MEHVLSVLIPAYNEQETIGALLQKVKDVDLKGVGMEIIVVNDCSTDQTANIVKKFKDENTSVCIKYLEHKLNQGKGMAIRTALTAVEGDIVIIQDADLETDPEDYNLMLPYIISGGYRVIYGSRFLMPENKHICKSFYLGGRLVSWCANILYFQHLTDEPTCYKMFETSLLKSIPLKCTGFEFCPEITAKVSKLGYKIKEVPIHYYPRSIEEGKKIKWYDGLKAILTLVRYRFSN